VSHLRFLLHPGTGVKYCDQCVWCLFVCLHISKTACPNFTKFSVRVTRDNGLVILWRQCDTLCTSGLVDDVIWIQYSGANMLEPEMTRMSRSVRQMAAPFGRQTTLFGRDRRVAAPGRSLPSSTASFCIWHLITNKPALFVTPMIKQEKIVKFIFETNV